MQVVTTQPFEIVYSVFQHEFLGYLFESHVVQVNTKGELTFQYQNISTANAKEFAKRLTEADFEIIDLTDKIQQEYIIKQYCRKKTTPAEFFLKIYDKAKGDKALQEAIEDIIESRKQKILHLLRNKPLFIMGKDGYPAWRQLQWAKEEASVRFHFWRNPEDTHYYPTIKVGEQKLDIQNPDSFVLANRPAYLVAYNTIHTFRQEIEGKKLKPFLRQPRIIVPHRLEDDFYRKFVAPLAADCDIKAHGEGFHITRHEDAPQAVLLVSEMAQPSQNSLFDIPNTNGVAEDSQIQFDLQFQYGDFRFRADENTECSSMAHTYEVSIEQQQKHYTLHKVRREIQHEHKIWRRLKTQGLEIRRGRAVLPKTTAFAWLAQHAGDLHQVGIALQQEVRDGKRYFLGRAEIQLQIHEAQDWFDIKAKIRFGEYEIPFVQLRKIILQRKTEFLLPNGEIAVIPEVWLAQYAELFAFADMDNGNAQLAKQHLTLVEDLRNGNYAQVSLRHKLEQFQHFGEIEDYKLPRGFQGSLRPYQKAGYNWLRFLQEYRFGACLADDMGLGKTIMTLALLQWQKEQAKYPATLLVMPTSLIYNWELEARKFTPTLKVLNYTGTNRLKSTEVFDYYDVVITSYGIVRVDSELLSKYRFHYIILDESQAIKNPTSNISQAVRALTSCHRLILTGTPLENSTLDLWSQMSFANPGLLGTQSYFKEHYLIPIEKKQDNDQLAKLGRIIKPFILRRLKSQVATDLPPKIENVQYCLMTKIQEAYYERVKSEYRNEILKHIEREGVAKSQIMLLQGLTKLRQIANHPLMVDAHYAGDAGKPEDILYKMEGILSEGHKVLVFSQFVKHLQLFIPAIKKRGWRYAYLDGSTQNRRAEVDKFQNEIDTQIFLISLKAGGVGLNLTAAEYVFLLDPWWNPAIEAQAVDRAHRIGQQNTVFTYKFITKNTVEERILMLQQAKRQLADTLITTEEGFVKSLTREDVEALLS